MRQSILVVSLVLLLTSLTAGQSQPAPTQPATPEPLKLGPFEISGSLRVRAEATDWFSAPGFDTTYGYAHSILRVNFLIERHSWDFDFELAQPSVLGAPSNAVAPGAPGQLGFGANYFVANGGQRNSAWIYPSKLYFRFKGLGGNDRNKLTFGRFEFVDGMETTPPDKTLAALKTMRVAHRLIGNFAWSMAGRSEDGVSLSLAAGNGDLTFAAARPTRGVFQTDGLGELDVSWEYAAYTKPFAFKSGASELRVFAIGYQDVRALVKTDNRPLPVRQGVDHFQNINIATFGLHYIHVINTERAGKWDFLLWGAGQTGSWGLQRHRAGAGTIEMGWQPPVTSVRPWLRLGYFISSGDGNPNDNKHETFFSILPTPRWYARYPFYDQQNLRDLSAAIMLRPGSKLTLRSEFHNLGLTSRKDFWYQGGGAFQPRTFGYIGRPSSGHAALANLWDLSADYVLTKNVTLGAYFANVWGQSAIRSVYPAGAASHFGYVEFTYKF